MFAPPGFLLRRPVLRKLIPSIWKRYMLLIKPAYFVEKRMGQLHLIDPSNIIDKNLVVKGGWEKRQLALFARLINQTLDDGNTVEFWDVGAHAGLYSVFLSKHCDLLEVHALEPDHRSCAQLHANLLLNNLTDTIDVHKVAASDIDGEIPFYVANSANRGGSRIGVAGNAKISTETIVRSVRIDDYLVPKADVIAIKIDVEGHENRVFDGMKNILVQRKILLQIELFEDNQQNMKAFLEAHKFRLIGRIDLDHYFCNYEIGPAIKAA